MDAFISMIQSVVPEAFDAEVFLKAALVFFISFLVLGFLGRLAFGKHSTLNQSVSSAIGILFIYAVTILIYSYGLDLHFLVSPLPFVSLSGEYLHIFTFSDSDYVIICGQLLNMIILAFLVNLVNGWLPKGKKLLGWLFFRCLSVAGAMLLHVLVNSITNAFLPEGLLIWAPVILLGLLLLMLAVGALKYLIGAVIGSVNPLIGFLYTFFFATFVGKQLSKAILTTALISGFVVLLNYIGCSAVYIGAAALAAYVPLLIILLILWYVVGRKL